MNTLQGWLIVGVPATVLVAGLFSTRHPVRAPFGYLVLALLFLFFLVVVHSPVSAAVVGVATFVLVAMGRGDPRTEEEAPHEVPLRVDDPNIDDPERV